MGSGQRSEASTPVREALRSGARLRAIVARPGKPGSVDLEPGCAYGVVTREMVQHLAEELREIRGRLNQLMVMIAGAITLDILLRLAGLS